VNRHLVIAASVMAVLAAGCQGDAGPDLQFGEVVGGEVVETIAAPATIEPRDRVTVNAPATGVVAELFVEDGDEVAVGDPLARLDAPTVQQSIEQAEAAVTAANALAGIQTGVDLSPLIAAVRTQFESVIPPLLFSLTEQAGALPEEEQRQRALDAITEASTGYDEAVAALADAEQQAAASARAASASTRAAAAAQRAQAELALEAAQVRADGLLVTAPAAGVVELSRGGSGVTPDLGGAGDLGDLEALFGGGSAGSASAGPVSRGSEVSAGQSLLTIYDLSGFRMLASVDEIDAVHVQAGQRAVVLVDALGDIELDGVVDHVAIEPTVGTGGGVAFPVTVRLLSPPRDVPLRPGLSGSVEIVVNRLDADTVVSSSALRRRGGGEVVYVVRDDVIREVPVTVLAIGDDRAAVQGDLDVGETVVVGGIEEVADGDPVP
jgi:multidrug efflux pump subunit AcrA (membrane-fusion protein)